MLAEGKKSIHIQKDFYRLINIPSTKKKFFMDSNYSIIFDTYLERDKENIYNFLTQNNGQQ